MTAKQDYNEFLVEHLALGGTGLSVCIGIRLLFEVTINDHYEQADSLAVLLH